MSNLIRIETLWGWRRGEQTPELMEAWDEFSIDGYQEGWTAACKKAIASWGGDLEAHRYVHLTVDLDRIVGAFRAPTAPASVGGDEWCPVCHTYHVDPGVKTDAGKLVRQCSQIGTDDPRNVFSNYPGR